jgi:Bacterial SH3 domain
MGKVVSVQASRRRLRGRVADSCGFSLCVVSLMVWVLCGLSYSRTRETPAPSFTIDVDKPFGQVAKAVEDVARSSSIKGTFEYTGDQQLDGAQYEESSRLFPAWSGNGKVFFKVRYKALSPKHFINSSDVGTVAVRYIVQDNGANSTRLVIDAVFVENAGHHGHPSDGYVETCEFAEIGKRLLEFDQRETLRASGNEFAPGRESSSQPDKADDVTDSSATGDIRRAISDQRNQLAADAANLQQVEAQARQIRASEFMRVSAERAELKALPYSHARVVVALKQGQDVTVLARSEYWCRVRSEDGQEGWLPNSTLEARP